MDWTKVIASLHKTAARDMNAAADAETRRETGQAIALRMAAISQNRLATALEAGLSDAPVEEPKRRGSHHKASEAKLAGMETTAPKKRGRPPKVNRAFVGDSDFRPRG